MLIVVPLLAGVFGLLYQQELRALGTPLLARRRSRSRLADVGFPEGLHGAAGDRGHGRLVAGAGAPEPARWRRRNRTARRTCWCARSSSHRQTDRGAAGGQAERRPGARHRSGGRPGQPGQEPLHQRHQPRAAHAAQQHPGLCAADGRGRRRAAASAAGGGGDQARRRAPAVADRRHAGHRAHRGRQAHPECRARCSSPT